MAAYYWCRSCGLFSREAQVTRFGRDVYPYICPGCVREVDGTLTFKPGKENDLRPWPDCADENPDLPERPTVGTLYPPPSDG